MIFLKTISNEAFVSEIGHKSSLSNNRISFYMRFLLFLTILFIHFFPIHAQYALTKEANTPVIGDILEGCMIKKMSITQDGEQYIWNLQDATMQSKALKIYYWEPDSLNAVPILVGNTIYCIDGNSTDTLKIVRKESHLKKSISNIPEVGLIFPFHYGDSIKGVFCETGTYCDKLKHRTFGTYNLAADGKGTIVLPNGDSLSNVLQIHKRKQMSIKYRPISDVLSSSDKITRDSIICNLRNDENLLYQDLFYLFCKGYRYPILIRTSSWLKGKESSGNEEIVFFDPYNQKLLALDDMNRQIRLEKDSFQEENSNIYCKGNSVINYTMTQDKQAKKIMISYSLSTKASVEGIIADPKGVVYKRKVQQHDVGEHYQMEIGYQNLPIIQTFIVHLNVNGEQLTEKFNK